MRQYTTSQVIAGQSWTYTHMLGASWILGYQPVLIPAESAENWLAPNAGAWIIIRLVRVIQQIFITELAAVTGYH